MERINYYNEIFKRKSVRKYEQAPLSEDVMEEIKQELAALKPLYEGIKTELKIVDGSEIKGLLAAKAPHYIVAFSEAKEGYMTNMGFMLQQMNLYFSAKGIGSCWLGGGKPTKNLVEASKLEPVIVLSFGKPQEELHRKSSSDFKRKALEEITSIKEMNNIFEAVRLAPSAVNSQPWYFTGDGALIHAYCVKPKLITGFMLGNMNKLDMGIALYHLYLAAEKEGKALEFFTDSKAQEKVPKGYYYNCSIKIK
ncbi:nitroreductase [Clostridium sp. 19966]|uniref:nitroreductase family protein n=1 Tax=Clostridium sp. 19966 TaxID=2768166 RepID=UPI0028E03E09|nr:nitroreductase family protein [Clostridium sp. 19966]MDT8718406.1 nitroreductase [Clostridium sp. 19966]